MHTLIGVAICQGEEPWPALGGLVPGLTGLHYPAPAVCPWVGHRLFEI